MDQPGISRRTAASGFACEQRTPVRDESRAKQGVSVEAAAFALWLRPAFTAPFNARPSGLEEVRKTGAAPGAPCPPLAARERALNGSVEPGEAVSTRGDPGTVDDVSATRKPSTLNGGSVAVANAAPLRGASSGHGDRASWPAANDSERTTVELVSSCVPGAAKVRVTLDDAFAVEGEPLVETGSPSLLAQLDALVDAVPKASRALDRGRAAPIVRHSLFDDGRGHSGLNADATDASKSRQLRSPPVEARDNLERSTCSGEDRRSPGETRPEYEALLRHASNPGEIAGQDLPGSDSRAGSLSSSNESMIPDRGGLFQGVGPFDDRATPGVKSANADSSSAPKPDPGRAVVPNREPPPSNQELDVTFGAGEWGGIRVKLRFAGEALDVAISATKPQTLSMMREAHASLSENVSRVVANSVVTIASTPVNGEPGTNLARESTTYPRQEFSEQRKNHAEPEQPGSRKQSGEIAIGQRAIDPGRDTVRMRYI